MSFYLSRCSTILTMSWEKLFAERSWLLRLIDEKHKYFSYAVINDMPEVNNNNRKALLQVKNKNYNISM